MSDQFRQSKTLNTSAGQQRSLPPGWTVKPEDSETSRQLIKWFADRGLEARVTLAEGPAGRALTNDEFKAIEDAAIRINGFDTDVDQPPTTPYPGQVTNDPVLASKFGPAPGQGSIQYGQVAQAAAVAPAGRPGVKGLEKLLAETDWQKRRPQVMDALDEVFAEVKRSLDKHGGFRSGHEGYAVLLEEVDELWDEIKNDNSGGVEARTEAIQVAAMAVKYAIYIASRPEPINSANWTGLDGD